MVFDKAVISNFSIFWRILASAGCELGGHVQNGWQNEIQIQ